MSKRTHIAVAAGLAVLAWAGLALWQASRAITTAEQESISEAQIRFSSSELRIVRTGVEQISAPTRFRDAALFEGKLYVAGPAGLFTDDAQYRVGDLLPPAPLTAMSVAITAQAAGPELWIGTAGEGMLAFRAGRFLHLRPTDARRRNVTSVLGLTSGRVLFGSEKAGVLAFDGNNLGYLHETLRDLHVTALAGDETDLWVGTIDRGLLHWRGGQITSIDGLPGKHVLSIATGDAGVVYAGTALGIAVVRANRVERVLADSVFAQSLFARGAHLYAGTPDAGLYQIPIASGRAHFLDTEAPVHRILEAGGRLIAVTSEGVVDARQGTPVLKPENAVLADRNVSAISVDSLGQIWVGYFDRGLDILDAAFTRARHLEDQHLFCVNRILHATTTAVATANGLVLFDTTGQKRQVLGRDQGLIANHITDVVMGGDEMVAATPAGLSFLGRDGIRSLYAFHGLVNNHAYAVGMAGERLMTGTLGGLSILERGTVRASYTTANSPLGHNWITAIATAGPETFIGTYGAGVMKLGQNGDWESFSDMPAATEINPGALAATGTHVYAGTLGKGLLVYNRAERRWRTVTQGLPSLNVSAVHVAKGGVFVGTDNGLVRIP